MIVLFVGSNPSSKNVDVKVPFEGTKSGNVLQTWIKLLEIADYQVINIFESVTPRNRPLTKGEIKSALGDFKARLNQIPYDKIIALGNSASEALKLLGVEHYIMPHPSGRNRKLNDKNYVDNKIESCKVYIYESN